MQKQFIDYQTKENRLRKHFELADSDDFFGYEDIPNLSLSILEKIVYGMVFVFCAYFAYEAVTFIIANGIRFY